MLDTKMSSKIWYYLSSNLDSLYLTEKVKEQLQANLIALLYYDFIQLKPVTSSK